MAIEEIIHNNIAANATTNELAGSAVEFIAPDIVAAAVRLLAVASAIDLDQELFIGRRNPIIRGGVSVSATPNDLKDPDNVVLPGAGAMPGERLRLNTIEVGGVATTDYRGRVIIRERFQ